MTDTLTREQCVNCEKMGVKQELFDGDWCYTHGPDGDQLRLVGRDGMGQEIELLSGFIKLPSPQDLKDAIVKRVRERPMWNQNSVRWVVETREWHNGQREASLMIIGWGVTLSKPFEIRCVAPAEILALYELLCKLFEMEKE